MSRKSRSLDPKYIREQGYLEITSNWEDESIIEVRIDAASYGFSGFADCYTSREALTELADQISGFPKSIDQKIETQIGPSSDLSKCLIKFECVSGLGDAQARVEIIHLKSFSNKQREEYHAEFDLPFEPASLDHFVTSLRKLANAKIGCVAARLEGKTFYS